MLDSRTLDYPLALRMVGGGGAVWGAVQAALTPAQQQRAAALGLAVTPLADLTLLHLAAPGAPAQAQAAALLRWEAPDDPSAVPGLALLDAARPADPPAPNLLPPPSMSVVLRGQASPHGTEPRDRWALFAGTALAPGGPGFLLHPGGEVNVTLATARAVPGRPYTLLFRVRNGALAGEQRVYVTAEGANRRPLATFPTGAGYLCPRAPDWAPGGFAFVIPADTQLLTVWLRARGTGTAEFADVALRAAP